MKNDITINKIVINNNLYMVYYFYEKYKLIYKNIKIYVINLSFNVFQQFKDNIRYWTILTIKHK